MNIKLDGSWTKRLKMKEGAEEIGRGREVASFRMTR